MIGRIWKDVRTVGGILRRETGMSWPLLLLRALVAGRRAFRATRWYGKETAEARFVRRMLILPGLFRVLSRKLGRERALRIMDELMRSLAIEELAARAESVGLRSLKDRGERMRVYRRAMVEDHIGEFNAFDYLAKDQDRLHFRVTRCVFHEFFSDMGTPELTGSFCDADRVFFARYFPEYEFHRNGSWNNTLGRGSDFCEYVIGSEMSYNTNECGIIEEPACAIR